MRRTALFFAGFVLANLTVLAPEGAQAATDCDRTVVDTTSGHVLNASKIEIASTKLEREFGADVRVRAFQSAPDGGMAGYVEQMVQNCASWHSVDGQLKGNLIVFSFSMDKRSNITVGPNYTDEMDGEIAHIRDTVMGDRFREGDFTAGIIDAENATIDALKPSMAGTYVLRGLGLVLLLALLIGAVVAFIYVRRQRAEREAERLNAQRAAIAASDKATEAVGALSMESVERDYKIVTGNLNDRDKGELEASYLATSQFYAAAINGQSAITDNAATLNPNAKLTTARYVELTDMYDEVYAKSLQASVAIATLENNCADLIHQIEQAPVEYARLDAEHKQLVDAQAALQRDGYEVNETDELNEVRALLNEAKRQIDAKCFGQAIDELSLSSNQSAGIKERLDALRTVREELASRHARLMDSLGSAQAGVSEDITLDAMRSSYDESCWRDASDRRDALVGSFATAAGLLDRAEQAFSMDTQKWESAAELLDSAESAIGDPDSFPALVRNRSNDLEALARRLPAEIDDIAAKARSAAATVGSLRGKQGSRKTRLSELEAEAESLGRALRENRPALLQLEAHAAELSKEVADTLRKAKAADKKVRDDEAEEERRARQRRQSSSYSNSSNSGFGTGFGTGYIAGGGFDSGSSGGSSGGGFSSDGGWGGGGSSSDGGW